MSSDSVLLKVEDGVATVTLNQPEVRNALTPELRTSFREIIASLEVNIDARCIVITGAGEHFMSGGDIRSMIDRLGIHRTYQAHVICNGTNMWQQVAYVCAAFPMWPKFPCAW